jgi:hypothetical protein
VPLNLNDVRRIATEVVEGALCDVLTTITSSLAVSNEE